MFDPQCITDYFNVFDDSKRGKMLTVYISSFENHTNVCDTGLKEEDMSAVQASSHDLKSLLRTIGATELGERAEHVEYAAMEEKTDFVSEKLPPFLEEVTHVTNAMKALLENLN